VKIMTRIVLSLAALAALVCFDAPKSHAGTYGDAPWCAMRSLGTGEIEFDCEYASAAECAPTIVAGNRGFCTENPYFVAANTPATPSHRKRHKPRH
jgi:hypothetical protein